MGQEPDLTTLWLQLLREMSQEMWGTHIWHFTGLEWLEGASGLIASIVGR